MMLKEASCGSKFPKTPRQPPTPSIQDSNSPAASSSATYPSQHQAKIYTQPKRPKPKVSQVAFHNLVSNTTYYHAGAFGHIFEPSLQYLRDQWPDLVQKSPDIFAAAKNTVQTKALPWQHYQLVQKLYDKNPLLESWRWTIDSTPKTFLPLCQYLGTGVDIFVIDSGIDTTHPEFNGRARQLVNYYNAPRACFEHGTAVASAAAGLIGGLAKNSPIYAVVVGICPDHVSNTVGDEFAGIATGGSTEDVVKSLEDISTFRARQHAELCRRQNRDPAKTPVRPAIINISLGVPDYKTPEFFRLQLDRVLSDNRTIICAAAGNESQNASKLWPANESRIMTIGSYDEDYVKAGFSNRGMLVDLYAPGSRPLLASIHSPLGYDYFRGTSFASPYAAGFMAAYWSLNLHMDAVDVENVARTIFYKDASSIHEVA
jgi:subtilisin family serine protease